LATPDGDVEPTGASVDLPLADVSRVRDGKIASYHTYYDQLGLMTQLGCEDRLHGDRRREADGTA
jgi:ketosteroid isomerase-like protein